VRAWGVSYERPETGEFLICVTPTIGCLVIQAIGGLGADTESLRTGGSQGGNSIGIFPPQTLPLQWPPPNAFNDETVLDFAKPLGR
jgi:hypothetical protein